MFYSYVAYETVPDDVLSHVGGQLPRLALVASNNFHSVLILLSLFHEKICFSKCCMRVQYFFKTCVRIYEGT